MKPAGLGGFISDFLIHQLKVEEAPWCLASSKFPILLFQLPQTSLSSLWPRFPRKTLLMKNEQRERGRGGTNGLGMVFPSHSLKPGCSCRGFRAGGFVREHSVIIPQVQALKALVEAVIKGEKELE